MQTRCQPSSFAIASAAVSASVRKTWAQTLSVTTGEECPSRAETMCTGTPAVRQVRRVGVADVDAEAIGLLDAPGRHVIGDLHTHVTVDPIRASGRDRDAWRDGARKLDTV